MKRCILALGLMFLAATAFAAAYSTRLPGPSNWNAVGAWSTAGCGGASAGAAFPTTTDTATICNGHTIAMNISPTITNLTIAAGGILNAGASTLTLTGTAGTLFTRAGTFNQGSSTVIMSSNASVTLTSGAITFNNLQLTPILTTANRTYSFGAGAITVNGDFDVSPTDSTGGANTLTVNMGAAITVLPTGTTTIQGLGTATATLSTTGTNFAFSSGRLVMNANGTFNANASVVTLTATSGTLLTETGNGNFAPGTSTVVMNGDGDLTLTSGVFGFNNLQLIPTLTGNRIYTFGPSPVTIAGNLVVTPPAAAGTPALTVNMGAAIDVTGSTTLGGNEIATLNTTASNFAFSSGTLVITANGALTANGSTITLDGAGTFFTLDTGGTFTPGTSTVIMTNNSNRILTAGTATSITFNNLQVAPALAGNNRTYTFGAAPITINGDFDINPTDSTAGSNSLTVTMGNTITVAGTTTIQGSGTSPATAILNSTAANDYALTSGLLVIGANGTFTANNSIVTLGLLDVETNGTFNANTSTVTLNASTGPLFTLTGTFNQATCTVVMNSPNSVDLNSGVITFYNLSMKMAGKTGTLGNNITVTNQLNFNPLGANAGGTITTGANTVTIPSTGSIAGAGPSGHVVGNLARGFTAVAGASFTYTLGDGTNYTPVTVTFPAAPTAGNLTVSSQASIADHPTTTSGLSPVEPTKSVNRYWTLKNSTLNGTATITFNYIGAPTDVDPPATPSAFVFGRGVNCTGTGPSHQCATWSSPTVSGTPTATVATASGVVITNGGADADFVIGEARRVFGREKEFVYSRELY
jgi:hypothetical protein